MFSCGACRGTLQLAQVLRGSVASQVPGRNVFKLDDKFNGDEFALQLEVARAPADRLAHADRFDDA